MAEETIAAEQTQEPAEKTETLLTQPEEGSADTAKADESQVVPEKYELKLPEDSLLDASRVDEVAAFAKEHKLSNDQAQRLLERENELTSKFSAEVEQQQRATLEQYREQWAKDSSTDKEIGGEAFNRKVEIARRVVQKYGTQEFRDALNESGFGNHPEIVRVFSRIGEAMAEDRLVTGGNAAPKKPLEPWEILYKDSLGKEQG